MNDFFNDNFDIVAEKIGVNAAIVKQLPNSTIEWQLEHTLGKLENSGLASVLSQLERKKPGLLMINGHPFDLTPESKVVYIPFALLSRVYQDRMDELARDIECFAKNQNDDLLSKTSRCRRAITNLRERMDLSLQFGPFLAINVSPWKRN